MMDRKNLLKVIFAIGKEVVDHLLLTVLLTLIRQDALIKENRRITINELAKSLGISAESAVKIMDTLGYSKCVCKVDPKAAYRGS